MLVAPEKLAQKEAEGKQNFEQHVVKAAADEPVAVYNQGGVEFIEKAQSEQSQESARSIEPAPK